MFLQGRRAGQATPIVGHHGEALIFDHSQATERFQQTGQLSA